MSTEDWEIAESYTWVNERDREYVLTPGVEFKVKGLQGKFTFKRHVISDSDEWIDCHGGTANRSMSRAFRPERITKVLTDAEPKKPKATAAPKKRHGLPI